MKDTLKNIIKAPTRFDFGVGFFLALIILAGLLGVTYLKQDQIINDRQARIPSVTVSVALGRATTNTVEAEILPVATPTIKKSVDDVKKELPVPDGHETKTTPPVESIPETTPEATPEISDVTEIVETEVNDSAVPIDVVETEELGKPAPENKTGLTNDDMVTPSIETAITVEKEPSFVPTVQLTETSAFGAIPRIASDGTIPWLAHAKQGDGIAGKKHIALVVSAVGQSDPITKYALTTLPHATTLAITPYTRLDLMDDTYKGLKNFETLLMLPMESKSFPIKDPGPRALISNYSKTQNTENLHWVLSRTSNYIGIMNMMGDAFLNGPEGIVNLFTELRDRGLTFLNTISPSQNLGDEIAKETGIPYLNADLFIDDVPSRQEIMAQLKALEIIAQETGYAIGVTQPLPLTFSIIAEWQERLGDDIALVPLSVIYKDNYRATQ